MSKSSVAQDSLAGNLQTSSSRLVPSSGGAENDARAMLNLAHCRWQTNARDCDRQIDPRVSRIGARLRQQTQSYNKQQFGWSQQYAFRKDCESARAQLSIYAFRKGYESARVPLMPLIIRPLMRAN